MLAGKNQYGNTDNISISTDFFAEPKPRKKKADAGTSRAYTLTLLKNERPDLFEKVCAKELTANRAATGKDGNAAEVEARRKGDAGEVIQFLREQSVINDGLLDTDTNRTLHISEIHASPQWLWSALVKQMVESGWTVQVTRDKVGAFKEVADPPGRSGCKATKNQTADNFR